MQSSGWSRLSPADTIIKGKSGVAGLDFFFLIFPPLHKTNPRLLLARAFKNKHLVEREQVETPLERSFGIGDVHCRHAVLLRHGDKILVLRGIAIWSQIPLQNTLDKMKFTKTVRQNSHSCCDLGKLAEENTDFPREVGRSLSQPSRTPSPKISNIKKSLTAATT